MEDQVDQILRCHQWFFRLGEVGSWTGPRAEQPLTFEEYCARYPAEAWVLLGTVGPGGSLLPVVYGPLEESPKV